MQAFLIFFSVRGLGGGGDAFICLFWEVFLVLYISQYSLLLDW